jgi:hypothetical protein
VGGSPNVGAAQRPRVPLGRANMLETEQKRTTDDIIQEISTDLVVYKVNADFEFAKLRAKIDLLSKQLQELKNAVSSIKR